MVKTCRTMGSRESASIHLSIPKEDDRTPTMFLRTNRPTARGVALRDKCARSIPRSTIDLASCRSVDSLRQPRSVMLLLAAFAGLAMSCRPSVSMAARLRLVAADA